MSILETDEQIAAAYLANGFLWVNRQHSLISVRLTNMQQADALRLKARFSGSARQWKETGVWQWEAEGSPALAFLVAVSPWVKLTIERREP